MDEDVVDLLGKMLVFDPSKRITGILSTFIIG